MANLLDLELGVDGAYDPDTVARLKKAGRTAGTIAGGFAPGAGLLDIVGKFPSADGGYEPSMWDNLRRGNLATAGMQAMGGVGDMMYAFPLLGATVGSGLKAPRVAQRAASAVTGRGGLDFAGGMRPTSGAVPGKTSAELAKMQKAELTSDQMLKVKGFAAQYPGFAEAMKFMTPQELAKTVAREGNVRQVDRIYTELPPVKEMAAAAKAGAPKLGWYQASAKALVDIFGPQDAQRFSAMLAATSPQTSVESNLTNALNIWKNWTAAGRPTDERSIMQIMGRSVQGNKGEDSVLDAWKNNTMRALQAEDPSKVTLSGPKVDSFFRNLNDEVYRVTNDAWMANGLGVDQALFSGSASANQLAKGDAGFSPGYIATAARIRAAGQEAGMLPMEAQETLWSYYMPLYERMVSTGTPARQLIKDGKITDEIIRGVPDFSTLLNSGQYGDILRQAGYGKQLDALQPFPFRGGDPSMALTPADQRQLMNVGKRMEDLRDLRTRESVSVLDMTKPNYGATKKPSEVTAYITAESVPGLNTGVLDGLTAAPFNTRKSFTDDVSAAFNDLQGVDRLTKALGLKGIQTRPSMGTYRPEGGIPILGPNARNPLEINPSVAIGARVPLTASGNIAAREAAKLDAAAAVRGLFTAQRGTPYNAQYVDQNGPALFINRGTRADPDEIGYTASLGNDAYAIADTGAGISVFDAMNGTRAAPTNAEADWLTRSLGGNSYTRTNFTGKYLDLAPQLTGPQGTGAATRAMFDYVDRLGKGDYASLSQVTPSIADDLSNTFRAYERKGFPMRQDFYNMFDEVKRGGLLGLRSALDSGKVALPALGGIGLYGLLQTPEEPTY